MGQLVQQSQASKTAIAKAVEAAPQQYLTFTLGGEMFAVAILNVKEIIEYGAITEIPMMPNFIRGVINLRGAVVPVIDLSCRFGNKATEVARRTCNVIIELNDGEASQDVGIMVDAVSEVLEIAKTEIEPPPGFGAKIRTDFISGMGKVNGKFVIILNVNKVLSIEEIAMLSKMGDNESLVTEAGG
ncbi:MAG: chemotaxis protein CheW [Proteobacteria bacterium]|nr:chemotaxis protein CheW [Pseudomonadota bacterium]